MPHVVPEDGAMARLVESLTVKRIHDLASLFNIRAFASTNNVCVS